MGSSLVNMYAKFGFIENAQQVFDIMPKWYVVSWNVTISGYVEDGNIDEAMKLFLEMHEWDVDSWTTILARYAHNGHLDKAMELYLQMLMHTKCSVKCLNVMLSRGLILL